jgi:hypothetical protein
MSTLRQTLDVQVTLARDAAAATARALTRLTGFTVVLRLEIPDEVSVFDEERAALTADFQTNRARLKESMELSPKVSGISMGGVHWVIENGKVEWIRVAYLTKECWQIFPHLARFQEEPCLSKYSTFDLMSSFTGPAPIGFRICMGSRISCLNSLILPHMPLM